VGDWTFSQPAERRAFADRMPAAILAQRTPVGRGAPAGRIGVGMGGAGLALIAARLGIRRRRFARA
jgi:hypothetical protein